MTTSPLRQAISDFSAGRAEEARCACREILRRDGRNAGALHLLGLVAHSEGNSDEAAKLLRLAVESPQATALHWLSYAELACRNEDLTAAAAAARRAVGLDDSSALAWFCLGNLLLELHENEESGHCFEQVMRRDPAFWQARVNLALIRARLGDPMTARGEFERLLRELPDHAELHANYAALLHALGSHGEALAQAKLAVALEPDTLEHHLRAADIELHMGRHQAALDRLRAVVPRWPDDPRRTALEAHVLRRLDRNEEAVSLCREATDRGIDSPELARACGLALHLVGQETLALAAFDRAVGLASAGVQFPGSATAAARALSDKAVLFDQLGRSTAASDTFAAALAKDPRLAEAWYNRANSKTHRSGDPDIAAMQSLLASAPHGDRILLHFALGKAHHEAGDVDAAFRHWHRANALYRETIEYDAAAASLHMARIQSRHAEAAAAGSTLVSESAADTELPVFIVGMPRSGSTLVEQILASHPAVHGGGELLGLRALFDADADAAAQAAQRLRPAVLTRLRRASPSALRVVDKDLMNFMQLGLIHRVFPRARIIHCRRDPLETCFSAYTRLFQGSFGFAYRLDELGGYYRDYHALMAYWRSALPPRVFIDVDYEAVVSDPRKQTHRLLDFLGLEWDETCLRFFGNGRMVVTSSFAQVRRPIYRSSLYRARALLTHLGALTDALGDLAPAHDA